MTSPAESLALRGASVFVKAGAHETVELAARELARYLLLLTGEPSALEHQWPETGTVCAVTIDPDLAQKLGTAPGDVGEQGFRLKTFEHEGVRGVAVVAAQPVGVLYGVYELLEQLGMGFYFGGDTFPDVDDAEEARVPANLTCTMKPAFGVRGNMLHYNFLVGPTTWGLEDYKFYFDQLARMRANLLLMHWYDNEPGGFYEVDGQVLAGGPAPNSLSKPWGALAALRTSQFSFGTGDWFDDEIFSSRPGERATDTITELRESAEMFSEATRYARRLGVRVAAGFEEPRGDPTDPEVERRFRARVSQFIQRNPHLTYFALWNHESGGSVGTALPARGTSAEELYREHHDNFAYLGHKMRVWEAIRFGRFAGIAHEVIQEAAPHLRLVLVGWGGDRWMQFADYSLGYDRWLPKDVIFTCHDNIDATICRNVSTPWGQLPPDRERWAMPWVEGDLNECWSRQPNVEALGVLAPDALEKGAQGLLTLHWRTRDVEEEAGFAARFAWDTELTPDRFYGTLARHAFGPDQEEAMGERLATLQRLGARWTGVPGCPECGKMRWTGWEPHIPFQIDADAALHLREYALQAADALAEIPVDADADTEAGMFHMREEETTGDEPAPQPARMDRTRPGVNEYQWASEKLLELSRLSDPEEILTGMKEIEEKIYELRPKLIHAGIPAKCHSPVDVFLIRIHHLTRHGNVVEHYEVLEEMWEELAELRDQYVTEGRIERLERLDYLMATMEFVMDYDRAAMMLASGEEIDRALAACEEMLKQDDPDGAAALAASTYEELVEAGMQDAVLAYDARKLTTRNDWGVLCTINVKALPLYWDTIGRVESYLTAVPPRELRARGDGEAIRLEWTKSARAEGFVIYRRSADEDQFTCLTEEPLEPATFMFVDRPGESNRHEYAIAAVDEEGFEGPRSHPAVAAPGQAADPPAIAAPKPASVLDADRALPVRVVVLGENVIRQVALCYRRAGQDQWTRVPMLHRFRNSWQAAVPAAAVQPGVLLFYVEAEDAAGRTATWPETAPDALPWSATVVPASTSAANDSE